MPFLPFFHNTEDRTTSGHGRIINVGMFPSEQLPEMAALGYPQPAMVGAPSPTQWAAGSGGNARGVFSFPGVAGGDLYAIRGTTFARINSVGAPTFLSGSISGTDLAVMDMVRDKILICANGLGWYTDGSTLTQITDSDLGTIGSICGINSRAVATRVDSDTFVWSDVLAPGTIAPLSFATAETYGDNLVRAANLNGRLVLFGERSIELWVTGPSATQAFVRAGGAIVDIGLAAKNSFANAGGGVAFFLAKTPTGDLYVARFDNGNVSRVSNPTLEYFLQTNKSYLANVDGWCSSAPGSVFYVLSIPDALAAFAYHEQSKSWCEYPYTYNCAAAAFNLTMLGSRSGSNIHSMGPTSSTALTSASTIQSVSEATRVNCVRILHSSPITVTTDASVVIEYSDNNGRDWISRTVTLDRYESRKRQHWNFGIARPPWRVWRVRNSDRRAIWGLAINEPGFI